MSKRKSIQEIAEMDDEARRKYLLECGENDAATDLLHDIETGKIPSPEPIVVPEFDGLKIR
jgi:hypothetical protein